MNKYRYGLVDLSYILNRNVFSCFRKDQNTVGDIVRSIIQTIGKLGRDYDITADKYILLNDTWSKIHGGYFRTYLLKGSYKTTRHHTTKEELEELKNNPLASAKEIAKAEESLEIDFLKREAKKIILSELGNYGIPCVSVAGWEFDDLIRLSSVLLDSEPTGKSSVVITKDSDLLYSLTPRLDYFKIPSGGSIPQIINYSQVWYSVPEKIRESGLSLYDYKSYVDSLGSGHNDMTRTKKFRGNTDKIILQILSGDYSGVENKELFETQLKTFRIQDFPNFDEAQAKLIEAFTKSGKIKDYEEFKLFCDSYKLNTDYETPGKYISERYYNEIINNLDKNLYETN